MTPGFRAKVQEALEDPRPAIPYEDVEAHFAKRRAAALRKAGEGDACVDFERKSVEK